jgi:hypothetical protein
MLVATSLAFLVTATALSSAVVIRDKGVQITVLSQVMPYKLPRKEPAPIAVFVAGALEAVGGGIPPQLERLRIQVNRNGLLQSRGLPVCRAPQVQPATTERALATCGSALIGSGRFWAHIVLPGQVPYPTQGRLLIFNGRQRGRPTLMAHIYTSNPFHSSFLVNFAIRRVSDGPYGTELTASLPETLGSWGYLDRIKLTLKRQYRLGDRQLSYFNAACPAPGGTNVTAFPLAKATFFFRDRRVAATVDKACGVRE